MGAQLDTWQLVEAPAAVPLPFGLFSVAEIRLTTDEHWRLGIQWQSQACSPTKLTTGPCIEPEVDPLSPDDYCSVVQYEPFTVYSYYNDEIPGATLEQHRARAIQRLNNGEQYSAEQSLWTALSTAAGPAVDLTAQPVGLVLGYVEQALADAYFGQGVIHMSRATATFLWEYLSVQGGRLQTLLGTPVIAGSGYDTLGAPDNDFYIYGSGPVVLYRGDVDTRENAVDRAINRTSIIAQRDYAVGFDCFAVGVKGEYAPGA